MGDSMAEVQSAPGSFFKSLFDFSFRDFITPSIVQILYVLALIGIGLWALITFVGIIGMFDDPMTPTGFAVVALLLWPLAVLLAVVYARVVLEFIMVVFRIGADVRSLVPPLDDDPPQSPPSAPPG